MARHLLLFSGVTLEPSIPMGAALGKLPGAASPIGRAAGVSAAAPLQAGSAGEEGNSAAVQSFRSNWQSMLAGLNGPGDPFVMGQNAPLRSFSDAAQPATRSHVPTQAAPGKAPASAPVLKSPQAAPSSLVADTLNAPATRPNPQIALPRSSRRAIASGNATASSRGQSSNKIQAASSSLPGEISPMLLPAAAQPIQPTSSPTTQISFHPLAAQPPAHSETEPFLSAHAMSGQIAPSVPSTSQHAIPSNTGADTLDAPSSDAAVPAAIGQHTNSLPEPRNLPDSFSSSKPNAGSVPAVSAPAPEVKIAPVSVDPFPPAVHGAGPVETRAGAADAVAPKPSSHIARTPSSEEPITRSVLATPEPASPITAAPVHAAPASDRSIPTAPGTAVPHDTFAALDSASAAPAATWIQAGARHAEAGYLDPALGWVSVRADASGSTLHAAIVPGSSEAAQALGIHMSGLHDYLAEHHGQAPELTMAAPENASSGGHGDSYGHAGQDNPSPESGPVSQSEASHSASSAAAAAPFDPSAPAVSAGGHISVMA